MVGGDGEVSGGARRVPADGVMIVFSFHAVMNWRRLGIGCNDFSVSSLVQNQTTRHWVLRGYFRGLGEHTLIFLSSRNHCKLQCTKYDVSMSRADAHHLTCLKKAGLASAFSGCSHFNLYGAVFSVVTNGYYNTPMRRACPAEPEI